LVRAEEMSSWNEVPAQPYPARGLILVGIFLLLLTKALDRGPAILDDSGEMRMSPIARKRAETLEEALEAALPAFFLLALRRQIRDDAYSNANVGTPEAPRRLR
jgi:hypothetical protein